MTNHDKQNWPIHDVNMPKKLFRRLGSTFLLTSSLTSKGIRLIKDETFPKASFVREHVTIYVPYITIKSYFLYWRLNRRWFFQEAILIPVFFIFSVLKKWKNKQTVK